MAALGDYSRKKIGFKNNFISLINFFMQKLSLKLHIYLIVK